MSDQANEERYSALVEACIEAVQTADNGDYYEDGLSPVDEIEKALAALGVRFGPTTFTSQRRREVFR